MRYDPRHKARTRERLLDEAETVLRLEGPQALRVIPLMARAGLTHGAFYAHFKSRQHLVDDVVARMFEQAPRTLNRYATDRGPGEALAAYVAFYLSADHRDTPLTGCPLPILASELPRMDPSAREQFTATHERLRGRLAELARAAGCDDAEALVTSLLSELIGTLASARAISDPARSDQILETSRRAIGRRLALALERFPKMTNA